MEANWYFISIIIKYPAFYFPWTLNWWTAAWTIDLNIFDNSSHWWTNLPNFLWTKEKKLWSVSPTSIIPNSVLSAFFSGFSILLSLYFFVWALQSYSCITTFPKRSDWLPIRELKLVRYWLKCYLGVLKGQFGIFSCIFLILIRGGIGGKQKGFSETWFLLSSFLLWISFLNLCFLSNSVKTNCVHIPILEVCRRGIH